TTAEVVNTLVQGAGKAEACVEKNQKIILSVVGAIAIVTLGYLAYNNWILEPKQNDAADAMFVAQQNFQQATDGVKSDSLYTLALNGSDGQFGFVEIANEYSGTDAGNLANYYAGISYLNLGKFEQAIEHLDKFKSEDMMLSA